MSFSASLENVLSCCHDYWNLKVTDTGIEKASRLESFFQWAVSFFSYSHLNRLKNKVIKIIDSGQVFSTEKEKIILEKINTVISKYKRGWLYGIKEPVLEDRKLQVERSFLESSFLMKPQKEKGRFVNHPGENVWSQFLETMRLLFPGSLSKATQLKDINTWFSQKDEVLARSFSTAFTWIGHSSLLIQLGGLNFLLDPIFGFCPPCFPRHTKPGIELEDLPLIDVVFVSHNHYDHCEPQAIAHLAQYQPVAITPDQLKDFFSEKGYQQTEELKWWQKIIFKTQTEEVTITSVPAVHNSQTSLSDMNQSHWHGCVIEYKDQKIYFAGDTAYNEDLFQQLKALFGTFDIVFMPISPEGEKSVHVDTRQALQAFEYLEAKQMIPIHYGAYRQSREKLEDPLIRMRTLLKDDFKHLKEKISIPKIGQRIVLADQEEKVKRA